MTRLAPRLPEKINRGRFFGIIYGLLPCFCVSLGGQIVGATVFLSNWARADREHGPLR